MRENYQDGYFEVIRSDAIEFLFIFELFRKSNCSSKRAICDNLTSAEYSNICSLTTACVFVS